MRRSVNRKIAQRSMIALLAGCGALFLWNSCGTAPTAFPVFPEGTGGGRGNEPPSLAFREPDANLTVSQGQPFLIRWDDSDSDDNALISFSLINTITNNRILLAEGIDENDTVGPDTLTVATSLITIGQYNLIGTIDDSNNAPVEVFAPVVGATTLTRAIITVVRPGEGPTSVPPQIAVIEPSFNRAVSQDDTLTVVVQPTLAAPAATRPYDPDSVVTLYIVLDVDNDPTNDDPANPDPTEIIRLREQTIAQGNFDQITFPIPIDLNAIPPRPNGEPYFIRATAVDATNPAVHKYAAGSINVVRLASGLVDLFEMGRILAGVRWYGFTPGANLGTKMTSVRDFDLDNVADFVMVAQFGNPRNSGDVGEAYLVYGQDGQRYGGSLAVNAVSGTIPGVIFEAPPVRTSPDPVYVSLRTPDARTDGITDAAFIPDITGDGRPELMFGLPHVHGAVETMDYDPDDVNAGDSEDTVEITLTIRQGEVTLQEGDADPELRNPAYNGVDDTTLDSANPTATNGSLGSVGWRDAGPGQRKWGLIKFRDIFQQFTVEDFFGADIPSINATLNVRIFDQGANGTVHQAFTDFTEQTTFATYALNDGEPQAGVDYDPEELESINGGESTGREVDVSPLVQKLFDGLLAEADNELRFIIVSAANDGADETLIRSSEFAIEGDRPELVITFNRENVLGSTGCYPDLLVNNFSDTDQTDPLDIEWTAGGIAILLASENRDSQPRQATPPARLDSTSIALELVGAEPDGRFIFDREGRNGQGNIFSRADDYDDEGRIRGVRFMSGPFDFVDASELAQPPREDQFGQNVAFVDDLNNDTTPEIVISAPHNERYLADLRSTYGGQSTHLQSTIFLGSITVIPGFDWTLEEGREEASGTNSLPALDQQRFPPFGSCTRPPEERDQFVPRDTFQVYAETIFDELGGASSAGDFNQDGIADILCGAPRNDRTGAADSGTAYILYGRTILGDYDLKNANDPILRTPMLRIRGVKRGDQLGWRQTAGLDVNGDRIDDIFIGAPRADVRAVERASCGGDFDGDGTFDGDDLRVGSFNNCRTSRGQELFTTDVCKVYDYDNDGDVDDDDRCVFCCLSGECVPEDTCVVGLDAANCCANVVDNGFVAVIFGGVFTDGDRDISQIATTDLAGAVFYGAAALHRAGHDVSSAGDFNQDGFGDILIAVPGETRVDTAGRERVGVVYLIFGGTHLYNTVWNLSSVGSVDLPGIVFLSPYVRGRPNEAAPTSVAFIGDINNDGFGDIAIGNPLADFIDQSFPQGPNATDAELGRRRNAGDVYVIYGNNFGTNRGTRP